jgi:nickel-dependent lactate racemase
MKPGAASTGGLLRYGRGEIPVPEEFVGAHTAAPPELPGIGDIPGELRQLLSNPADSPPLREFVEPGDAVTVVASDIARPGAASDILPVILDEISHAAQVRILIALGLHRKLKKTELKTLLGEEVAGSYPVFQHDAKAQTRLIFLGRTRYGTEVQLSRFVLAEEVYRSQEGASQQPLKLILTGTIAPHYFFGFSGGRKSILPGCASAHSIKQNHFLVLGPDGERVPECRAGNLADNPCHLDSVEAARMVGDVFMVNTVHTGGAGCVSIVAGDMEEAHLQGCRFYMEKCSVALEERFDVVLASCGGYPRDIDFIQSHKALEYAFHAVKPGGTLILAAECGDGFGSGHFFKWFRYGELSDFYKALQSRYQVYGQTAYATLWKAKKVDILLLSSLQQDQVRQMSITPVDDLQEAAELVRGKYGGEYSACIMPYAGDTLIRDGSLKIE